MSNCNNNSFRKKRSIYRKLDTHAEEWYMKVVMFVKLFIICSIWLRKTFVSFSYPNKDYYIFSDRSLTDKNNGTNISYPLIWYFWPAKIIFLDAILCITKKINFSPKKSFFITKIVSTNLILFFTKKIISSPNKSFFTK